MAFYNNCFSFCSVPLFMHPYLTLNLYRVIQCLELFSALVTIGNQSNDSTAGGVMFSREDFAVYIIEPEPGPNGSFQGQLIEAGFGLDIGDDVDFTQGMFTNSGSSTTPMSLASVFLTQELLEIFQSNMPSESTRLIFVAYDIDSPLFQDPNRNETTGSIILSVLQSPLQSTTPPTDLEELVMFQYQINQVLKLLLLAACKSS